MASEKNVCIYFNLVKKALDRIAPKSLCIRAIKAAIKYGIPSRGKRKQCSYSYGISQADRKIAQASEQLSRMVIATIVICHGALPCTLNKLCSYFNHFKRVVLVVVVKNKRSFSRIHYEL